MLLYKYYFIDLGVSLTALGISLVLVIYGIWDMGCDERANSGAFSGHNEVEVRV
ncbi:MAG: hypothetical protein ACTSQO_12150 [Candidatus Helarchaeota archaeon]